MATLSASFGDLRANRRRLVQAGVVLADLSIIVLLAQRYTSTIPLLVTGSVVATGCAIILLRQPALGPLLVVVGGLLVPWQIGTGTQSSVNMALVACLGVSGLWLLDRLASRRPFRLVPSRTTRPLVLLGLVASVAFVSGQIGWCGMPGAPLRSQVGGLLLFLCSIAAFLLVANLIPDQRWLARLTWLFLALGAAHVAVRMTPWLWRQLPGSLNGAEGSLFWTWLAALAFGQAVFNRQLRLAWRLSLAALAASVFYVGLGLTPGWSAGWLPPLIAVVVTLWSGNWRWGLIVTLLGLVVLAFAWGRVDALVLGANETLSQYGQAWTVHTRQAAWREVIKLVPTSPIIGFGPANYYWYTPRLDLLGFHFSFDSHSQYLDLLLQTGILGLGCFLWFAGEAGRLGWRLRRMTPEGFTRAYVYGALGGLAGTLAAGVLVDWVIPFVYNIGLAGFRSSVLAWLFLGGLVAVERGSSESELPD